ncbi:MAG: DPP IV N-terminal domain-containing protein [bacterium]|nr:DPP IV N-terminal domain-containing protein [bacterium]
MIINIGKGRKLMFWQKFIILLFIAGCSNIAQELTVKDIIWFGISDDSNYSWSKDSDKITFVYQNEIWIGEIINGNKCRLTFNKGKNPVWSPVKDEILYISAGDVWVKDINSFKDIQLTTDGKVSDAKWSPDGRTIAFVKEKNIWVMNNDGSKQKQLTTGNDNWGPLFSPTGDKIVFYCLRGGSTHGQGSTWLIQPDGTKLYKLQKSGKNVAWSPDGSRIICTDLWTDGKYSGHAFYIIIIDVNTQKVNSIKVLEITPSGVSPVIIGDINYSNHSFSWSPDGSKIAFDNNVHGIVNIYVVNNTGRNLCQLTSMGNATKPLWSPDGNKIMFKSENNLGVLVLNK